MNPKIENVTVLEVASPENALKLHVTADISMMEHAAPGCYVHEFTGWTDEPVDLDDIQSVIIVNTSTRTITDITTLTETQQYQAVQDARDLMYAAKKLTPAT